MLWTTNNSLGCLPLGMFQEVHIFLMLGVQELDAVQGNQLENKCKKRKSNYEAPKPF